MDLKAFTAVARRGAFPDRLLPPAAVCLGTLLVNVREDGVVTRCAFAAPPQPSLLPSGGYVWVNLERLDHDCPLHSNVLVFRPAGGRVRRYEPHGADLAHAAHTACGFGGWYSPPALDAAIAASLEAAGLLDAPWEYVGVADCPPVLPQSLTRNDAAPRNTAPLVPGVALKRRRGGVGLGDSFCGAWTLLYVAAVLGADVCGAAECDSTTAAGEAAHHAAVMAYIGAGAAAAAASGDAAALAAAGRRGADIIASFILRAHATYRADLARLHDDPEWKVIMS